MRAIVVDDEPLMLKRFIRLSEGLENLNSLTSFEVPEEAIEYVRNNPVEIAFLDIEMPRINGIELAGKLRELRSDILIVFISAYDDYVREFNSVDGDYYIIKPYDRTVLESMMKKLSLLSRRQEKDIYIQTFGTFNVFKKGEPVNLVGKAKEILAYVVTFRGKEVSNQEIYFALWEGRPYSNIEMNVYYNALRRLRKTLDAAGIGGILISGQRGQMVNPELFDCDYYAWWDRNAGKKDRFDGVFLPEYPWSEEKIAELFELY